MFKTAVGYSECIDANDAANEIFAQCDEILKGIKPIAGILFMSPECEYCVLLQKINLKYEGIELAGASSCGEMSSPGKFTEDSSVLVLFASDEVEIKAGIGCGIATDTNGAAKMAVDAAKSKLSKKAALCVAFPDVTFMNGVHITECISENLGKDVTLIGGGASRHTAETPTFQICKNEIFSDSVAVLIFSEPVKYSFGVASGWQAIGTKKTVTKSEKNIIYEIDDRPAAEFYINYFGCGEEVLGGEFPMMIFEKNESEPYIRAVIEINCREGKIKAAGDVNEGTTVQFAEADRDNIISGARQSAEMAAKYYGGGADFLLAISCAARKNILGTKTSREYETLKDIAPNIAGFYTYGEICPLVKGKDARFHNATFVTLLLGV